ncbi:unnamed protein product [Gongylonema pulchrum]|uniref:BTB/POZ domain-containing protein n=1 Tax=Gongylonema pulchrum TaxID=637853 RepID=A0A183EI13_9BILA|nr:unnamed protein product [Gongylonema pulchrum]
MFEWIRRHYALTNQRLLEIGDCEQSTSMLLAEHCDFLKAASVSPHVFIHRREEGRPCFGQKAEGFVECIVRVHFRFASKHTIVVVCFHCSFTE